MAPAEARGRVIGDVMGGLMVGVLLSRPLASLVADVYGWRIFCGASAVAMAMLTLVLARRLPRRQPSIRQAALHQASVRWAYPMLIASLWHLLRGEPVLRRRAWTASLGMAVFSLFWTAVALRLAAAPFDLSQRCIALFALVGAAGAVVTPLFGRAGDRGWTRPATIAAHLVTVLALALAAWAGSLGATLPSLVLMGFAGVLLDVGLTGDQTLGRRAINLLKPDARGRINGLFFLGGAVGSARGGRRLDLGRLVRGLCNRWRLRPARPGERCVGAVDLTPTAPRRSVVGGQHVGLQHLVGDRVALDQPHRIAPELDQVTHD